MQDAMREDDGRLDILLLFVGRKGDNLGVGIQNNL